VVWFSLCGVVNARVVINICFSYSM
jgi:hypothetical protein